MSKFVWLKPAIGLWIGAGQASKDTNKGGHAGLVLGDYAIQFGLLSGFNLGFGEKWGFFTGLVGAIALVPLWGFGFIGIPIGFHWKKTIGVGIIIPVMTVDPLISTLLGVGLFALALIVTRTVGKKILA